MFSKNFHSFQTTCLKGHLFDSGAEGRGFDPRQARHFRKPNQLPHTGVYKCKSSSIPNVFVMLWSPGCGNVFYIEVKSGE